MAINSIFVARAETPLKKLAFEITLSLVIMSLLYPLANDFRYVMYLVPFVSVLVWAVDGNFKLAVTPAMLGILAVIVFSIFGSFVAGVGEYKYVFFMATYMLPFMLLGEVDLKIDRVFYALVLVFILNSITFFGVDFRISIIESESTLENSTLGFIFGFFVIYFYQKKNFASLAVSVVLFVLSFKRVAMLALLLALIVECLPYFRTWLTFKVRSLNFLIFNALFLFSILVLAGGWLDSWFLDQFSISLNELLRGRRFLWEPIYSEVLNAPVQFFFLGKGVGSSTMLTENNALVASHISAVHSDLLRIFFEAGGVAFCLFFLGLYHRFHERVLPTLIYINVVFLTDNVIIYANVMFFFFVFYLIGRRSRFETK